MAIIKSAKNMTVEVTERYFVKAKETEKTAETIKLVATYGNIELYSTHKIRKNGNIN